jgi:hypothetical protein
MEVRLEKATARALLVSLKKEKKKWRNVCCFEFGAHVCSRCGDNSMASSKSGKNQMMNRTTKKLKK